MVERISLFIVLCTFESLPSLYISITCEILITNVVRASFEGVEAGLKQGQTEERFSDLRHGMLPWRASA